MSTNFLVGESYKFSERDIRGLVRDYKKYEGEFWAWFQSDALDFAEEFVETRKEKSGALVSMSEDMKGHAPPLHILEALNNAIQLRGEVNKWFEDEQQGTPVERMSHVDWVQKLEKIRWNLVWGKPSTTTSSHSVRRSDKQRKKSRDATLHPYASRNFKNQDSILSPRSPMGNISNRSMKTRSMSRNEQTREFEIDPQSPGGSYLGSPEAYSQHEEELLDPEKVDFWN